MRFRRQKPFFTITLILAALGGGCQSKLGHAIDGVDNFGVVAESPHALYRGAQPSKRGIQTLHQMGVRTVINLRNDADCREEQWVMAAGMRYVCIPSDCHKPNTQDLRRFLSIVEAEPADGAIFVHCLAGQDRTGLFIAAYRIAEDGWSPKLAIQELDDYGHNGYWCTEIRPAIRRLDPAALRN